MLITLSVIMLVDVKSNLLSVFFINLNLFTSFHEDMQLGMEIEATGRIELYKQQILN